MHLRISFKILTLATCEAPQDPHQPHLVPLPLLRTSWHRGHPLLFRQGLHLCQALGKAPICGLAHLILTIALRRGYPCLSLLYSRRKWGSDRLTDWQRTTQLMSGEAVVQTQTFSYHGPNTPTPHPPHLPVWACLALWATPGKCLLSEARLTVVRECGLVTEDWEKPAWWACPVSPIEETVFKA